MAKRKLANNEREWKALLKSKDKSFIRSMDDWKDALKKGKKSPLDGCPAAAVKHFTKHLTFNNGGLAHADYTKVGKHLNFFQFRKLWEDFGLGWDLFTDYQDKYCESKGTCAGWWGKVCTSNC